MQKKKKRGNHRFSAVLHHIKLQRLTHLIGKWVSCWTKCLSRAMGMATGSFGKPHVAKDAKRNFRMVKILWRSM